MFRRERSLPPRFEASCRSKIAARRVPILDGVYCSFLVDLHPVCSLYNAIYCRIWALLPRNCYRWPHRKERSEACVWANVTLVFVAYERVQTSAARLHRLDARSGLRVDVPDPLL